MKKLLLTMTALFAVGFINAQIYSSLDSTAFAAWTTYDNDGDASNWRASVITNPSITAPGFNGSSGYLSASYDATGVLTPDNLAISPAQDCSSNTSVYLNWKAGSPETTTSGWYEEHYAMYVVTASQLPGIILGTYPTPVFETTLTAGETFFSESVNVSSIAGGQSSVHVIVRHYNCTDENWIFLKDLTLTSAQPVGLEEISNEASVYPNPTNSILNVKTTLESTKVSIISMDGKVVATSKINGLTGSVDVSDLVDGVYFYEVAAADGSVVRNTFVKN